MLWLSVELFEVETAHIFEEIVAGIDFGHIEIPQLKGFEFSQLLVTQIEYILSCIVCFLVSFVDFGPDERAYFFIRDHGIIV